MKFVIDNWLALLSLAIALCGGLPGYLALKRRRANPALTIVATIPFTRTIESLGRSDMMLLLVVTIANKGDDPLSPASFHLVAETNLEPIVFSKEPFSAELRDRIAQCAAFDPINDLLNFAGVVTRANPVRGQLLFSTPLLSVEHFRNVTHRDMSLICEDVFGVQHRMAFNRTETADGVWQFPQHGVKIAGLDDAWLTKPDTLCELFHPQ